MSRRKFIGISMERPIHIILNSRPASVRSPAYPGFGSVKFLGFIYSNQFLLSLPTGLFFNTFYTIIFYLCNVFSA